MFGDDTAAAAEDAIAPHGEAEAEYDAVAVAEPAIDEADGTTPPSEAELEDGARRAVGRRGRARGRRRAGDRRGAAGRGAAGAAEGRRGGRRAAEPAPRSRRSRRPRARRAERARRPTSRPKRPPSRRPPRPLTTSSSASKRPVAVAITGGIGAGKSDGAAAFARHGAATVSSDEIVHHLLRHDEEVATALLEQLGDGILDEEGQIDRARVGGIVFGDRDKLAVARAAAAPARRRASTSSWREQLAELPKPAGVCVTEVPLLYEVGRGDALRRSSSLTASPRLRARRGRPVPEERADRQLPDDEKLRRADFAYVNNGSIEDLDAFVGDVMSDCVRSDANMT